MLVVWNSHISVSMWNLGDKAHAKVSCRTASEDTAASRDVVRRGGLVGDLRET